jgi:UDP-glucose 4-epimerase
MTIHQASKKNHIKDKRVNYIKGETINISKNLKNVKKKIHSIISFWRIC